MNPLFNKFTTATIAALTIMNSVQAEDFLEKYLWQKRLVIAYHSEDLSKQLLNEKEAITERHIFYFIVSPSGKVITNSQLNLSKKHISQLRSTFEKEKHKVILFGKDGGIKLRSNKLDWQQLYSLIDSMPMRQAEMRKK